ncbi:trehalose transporter 1-like protein [Onthophagus taurus]|uniref:trehalose transporter 1-like protein n=1 Tax=Onthophagus taurus TaxID=166361 RepID=UPI000C204EE6|nr:facilitated trehalose transporter Tret1-2 homolog [Onthophagus taurus]XP_022918546.1 facilitated trehalose transporter Tret1-2 homolog [Onthophagus taurus]
MLSVKSENFRAKLAQVTTVIAATSGAIADGMHYAWSSPIAPILRSPESPVGLISESNENLVELIYMIGGLAGLPATIFIVDKFGRKSSILISAVGNLISWFMIAFATRIEVIIAARFLCGMTGDMEFVAGPMYIAEIAEKSIRGLLCGFIFIAMLIGVVVMYSVGPFLTIQQSSFVGVAFVVTQIITFSFMPESPYYYLVKKQPEKSKKALRFLRGGKENVSEELDEMSIAVERQEKERGRPIDLLIDKGNRKALTIMTVLNAVQHFSSISVMLMNLHTILEDAEGILSSKYSGIVFSLVMLISALVAICVVDKFGRKILLVFSSLLTGISLTILATYFYFKSENYENIEYMSWVPVLAVLLYAFAFKCGLGLVPIVMTGELFPTSVKAMGMTISDAMYVIFATISLLIYQELIQFGIYVPFYLFAASCILTAAFVLFYVPETNGKTLEEIQFILKGLPYPQNSNHFIRNTNGNVNTAL